MARAAVTDLDEVRKVEAYLPVSREVLADVLDLQQALMTAWQRTPAEREAIAARQRAAASAMRAEVEAQHRAVVEQLDGVLRQVAEHHRPHVPEQWAHVECHGCDVDGAEWEYPAWPCSTYALVREAT